MSTPSNTRTHTDTGAAPNPDACQWRVVDLPLVSSNMVAAYNPDHVAFSAGTMTLTLDGTQGTRVASKGMDFLYGSFQVRVGVAVGAGRCECGLLLLTPGLLRHASHACR